MQEIHVDIKDLVFGYKKGEPVLDNLNMSIPKGSIYGFLGKNGAGKTTTIRNMLGLLEPNAGSIHLDGKAISRHAHPLLSKVGSLIENPSLYEHLSGIDNLRIVCAYYAISSQIIPSILDKVGLGYAGRLKAKKYSTGMKQRLGLAMALIHDPELLILDEPIRGLDPAGIKEIRQLILDINAQGTTIILSSHILSEIERLVTHLGVIENGCLKYEGTYQSLLQQIDASTRLLIRTADPNSLLQYFGNDTEAHIDGSYVSIPFTSDPDTARLIQEIYKGGYDLYEVRKDKNELENIFLGITNQNSQ